MPLQIIRDPRHIELLVKRYVIRLGLVLGSLVSIDIALHVVRMVR